MCWRKRPRRSVLVVIVCAIVYICLFNFLAIYSLISSYGKPASWVQRHGHLYLGRTDTNWTCKRLKYSTTPLPLTALVSFPGSGNTWMRHIIQEATGIATGSVYADESLKRHGFPAEGWTNSSVIVVKTHAWGPKVRMSYTRAVLLVRDPFDALLSEFNRRYGGHKGHAKKEHFQKSWYDYILGTAADWYDLYHDWLLFKGPMHVLMYKDLKSNPSASVDRLMKFLGVTLTHKEKYCVMKNFEGHFRRQHSIEHNDEKQKLYNSYMTFMINNYKRQLTRELGHFLNKSELRIS